MATPSTNAGEEEHEDGEPGQHGTVDQGEMVQDPSRHVERRVVVADEKGRSQREDVGADRKQDPDEHDLRATA